jgi:hypothetical protein
VSLSCILGLATCLNYLGAKIPEQDVFAIRVYCEELKSFPTYSFLMHIRDDGADRRGYMNADELERLGLEFRWKPDGRPQPEYFLASFRQKELLRTCAQFTQTADNPANWDS